MRSIRLLVCAGALLGSVQVAEAQNFAVEARGGVAIPTGEWNEDDDLETGWGFGVNARASVTPMIAIYAGWESYTFPLAEEDETEDVDADAKDQGFRAGAAFSFGMANPMISPFIEVGAIYNTTSLEATDGNVSVEFESDNGLGFEAGAGVAIGLGPNLSVTPAVRYRTHAATFEDFDEDEDVTVSYIVVDIGLRLRI